MAVESVSADVARTEKRPTGIAAIKIANGFPLNLTAWKLKHKFFMLGARFNSILKFICKVVETFGDFKIHEKKLH